MARLKYTADFETTTDINDCRVWASAYMEIGNIKNFKVSNNIDSFMEWCETANSDVYFHNLRFDGEFIVNWLLKNGFSFSKKGEPNTFNAIISSMNQWYMIDICYGRKGRKKIHTVLYDSLKKIPFKVSQIAKDFNLTILKGDIDYHAYRPVGHEITDDEMKYIINDVQIMAEALDIQFKQGLLKMTTGSDSISDFKDTITKKKFDKLYPSISMELDTDLRFAYRGGFTWLNEKYVGKEINYGLVFDVNSLYPSQMKTRMLPFGLPIEYDGEYEYDENYPLYIQEVEFSFFLKDEHIPTIQIKKDLRFKHTEYLKSSDTELVRISVTNIDWELIKEHYHVSDVNFIRGWKFRQKMGDFNLFIDKWTHVKVNNDGAIKLLAKLMLNSLYGKFATNPNVTGKEPFLKDDGSLGLVVGAEEFKDPVYTPMGIFITSWARFTTISTAQKCYDRIIYCDTDSIHLEGLEIPEAIEDVIDDKRLGYWQHESTFKRAKYIRQKTYVQELFGKKYVNDDGEEKIAMCGKSESDAIKFSVKCAGMSDRVKENVTFDNFERGFSSGGKLMPKHVNNGVVLVDTVFTLN